MVFLFERVPKWVQSVEDSLSHTLYAVASRILSLWRRIHEWWVPVLGLERGKGALMKMTLVPFIYFQLCSLATVMTFCPLEVLARPARPKSAVAHKNSHGQVASLPRPCACIWNIGTSNGYWIRVVVNLSWVVFGGSIYYTHQLYYSALFFHWKASGAWQRSPRAWMSLELGNKKK